MSTTDKYKENFKNSSSETKMANKNREWCHTMSGTQSDSHMPYICSVHVPLTAKSVATIGQPMRSRFATNGSNVTGSMPAITGSTKYGPKLQQRKTTQHTAQHYFSLL